MSFSFARAALPVVAIVVASGAVAFAGVLVGPAAIAVAVRDANGRPVSGAQISLNGPTERAAVTNVAGVVTLQAVPLGTYSVRIARSGYQPYDATVRVLTANVPTALPVQLTSSSFANIASVANGVAAATSTALGAGSDPYAAHAVAVAPGTAIVPSTLGAGVGVSLDGASPDETRVELDGIPIAGGAQGFNALRFRDALPLTGVSIARGPLIDATTVRDTVGGVIDYQTPAIATGLGGGLDFGYDAAFGAFQHARYTQTFGPLGLLVDTVAGGGENRAQTFKANYKFSSDVSIGVAAYGSQSDATLGDATLTSDAPAFAADLRASLGAGTLRVRSFESSARTYVDGDVPLENAAIRGLQFGYDISQGQDSFAFDYDRRAEDTTFGDGTTAAQAFHTFTIRGDFPVSAQSRFQIADSFEGGSTFAPRSDPRVAFALRASDRLTFNLAAGSAFATEPADAFATATLADEARTPETSFGLRLRADATLGNGLTAWGAAFETRRFDRPDSLPDASTAGLEIGLDRPARAFGFGANAYLDLQRGIAGTVGAAYDGVPASKARAAVAYRLPNVAFDFGTTLLGANNAFGARAVMLGDVGLRVPLLRLADIRLGIENLYGTRTPYSTLEPLFAPREFTLTVGRSP